MAGGKGTSLSNYVLDTVLGGTTYSQLGTVYLALYTVTPTSGGGGTEVTTSGTGYTRYSITNDSSSWSAASSGIKTNLLTFDFGTATGDWGTVVAAAIMSASTGGYILYWGPLTTFTTVNTDDGFRIPTGGAVLMES